jgi:hypothetical protein
MSATDAPRASSATPGTVQNGARGVGTLARLLAATAVSEVHYLLRSEAE